MSTPGPPPPPSVLRAFGLHGTPQPLPGGQGTSWRLDEAVLKPWTGTAEAAVWHGELLSRLVGRDDVRVSAPLRSADGDWSCDGWTASRYEPGSPEPGRWHEVIDAGARLHQALSAEPEPAVLSSRSDRWAVADRWAWERPLPGPAAADPVLARLSAARRPVAARRQLVHGDLTGNVLFCDGRPPLVLDLSLYWRPAGYASAIVVADALVQGHGEDVLPALLHDPDFAQHLLRALLFRALTDHLAGHRDLGRRYAHATDLAVRLADAR